MCCFTVSLCIICSPPPYFRSTRFSENRNSSCAFRTTGTCASMSRGTRKRKEREKAIRYERVGGERTHVDERTNKWTRNTHLFQLQHDLFICFLPPFLWPRLHEPTFEKRKLVPTLVFIEKTEMSLVQMHLWSSVRPVLRGNLEGNERSRVPLVDRDLCYDQAADTDESRITIETRERRDECYVFSSPPFFFRNSVVLLVYSALPFHPPPLLSFFVDEKRPFHGIHFTPMRERKERNYERECAKEKEKGKKERKQQRQQQKKKKKDQGTRTPKPILLLLFSAPSLLSLSFSLSLSLFLSLSQYIYIYFCLCFYFFLNTVQ